MVVVLVVVLLVGVVVEEVVLDSMIMGAVGVGATSTKSTKAANGPQRPGFEGLYATSVHASQLPYPPGATVRALTANSMVACQ